jgi:2-polyprenyl-3-methyl-5-hydroxy-6-metoxy-1,4-benzoquinol methylase
MTADQHESDCCAVDPRIASHFDKRLAEQTADGELPEMVDVSAMLLRLVSGDVAERRPSVLELGCGSGALSVALAQRGAARVDGVDLSPDAIAAAGRRATEAGVADAASFVVGDGALVEHAPHDWVVMDRVICCYPDPDGLLEAAARAAVTRVAFSAPIWRGWRGWVNRAGWGLENIPARLFKRACPTFVHDISRLERRLAAAGFARTASDTLGLWYAAVWERSPGRSTAK